jgi:hypothetical protein
MKDDASLDSSLNARNIPIISPFSFHLSRHSQPLCPCPLPISSALHSLSLPFTSYFPLIYLIHISHSQSSLSLERTRSIVKQHHITSSLSKQPFPPVPPGFQSTRISRSVLTSTLSVALAQHLTMLQTLGLIV